MIALILAAFMPLWAAQQSPPPKPATVQLRIKPTVCQEYCEITATITVTGYQAEREVCLSLREVDLDVADHKSCWPYSGSKTTDVKIRSIPYGSYVVKAELTYVRKWDTRQLRVSGTVDSDVRWYTPRARRTVQ